MQATGFQADPDARRLAEAGPAAAESLRVERRTVYLAIALSGFTALSAEVVWTRLLSLLFGGTTYTFSLILAGFLLGLGIGSSLGSAFARSLARPSMALGWCQAGRVRGRRLGRDHGQRFDAVLAHRPVDLDQPLVQLPARRGALSLDGAAGRGALGRELPAGAGGGGACRRRPGPDRREALRREHAGRHHRRARGRRARRVGGQPAHAAVHDRRGRRLGPADAAARPGRSGREPGGRPGSPPARSSSAWALAPSCSAARFLRCPGCSSGTGGSRRPG